ncbi:KUP/HAK/KT family potassium transporter [Alloscardovia criceti]|uniref:KUP/HAK/KT family potassium transporter n=1 Tax=Alloscardovia criceti TaxID=356828 RepID=UPI00035D26E6|nr:KUP/HAK/KT family potassium transporter [Alloscardovia criceti]
MVSEMDAGTNQDSGLANLAKDTAEQTEKEQSSADDKGDKRICTTTDSLALDLAQTGAILPPEGITKAPKVDEHAVSEEELEAKRLAEKEAKRTAELQNKKARTPLGRWWRKIQTSQDKISLGMMIVALGVVYGDIGTSPLYLSQSFITGQGGIQNANRESVLGMLSLLFWSVTLITTVKYVFIAMRIDNKGEGGIFALYSLVKRYAKWLWIPAMVGGAAFLADSVLTPAVSISSAVEGLRTLAPLKQVFTENPNISLGITAVIIVALFLIQSRGTESIGKIFGIVVFIWFTFLAITGISAIGTDWSIFEALNPVLGIQYLFSPHNHASLAIMGTVFLATTGAEALYSDMGHVGRGNIYATWPYIKVCLMLNYFGQGQWIIENQNNTAMQQLENLNPFFQMMPEAVRYVAVILSVVAGIIASQALISGAYTMVSEATGLNWMPHLQVRYPSRTRGQLYIPVVNWVLMVATLSVLAIFQDSERMTAAYGLALTVTMITTTILLAAYMWWGKRRRLFAVIFTIVFLAIQILFFISSMSKFMTGGWFTTLITIAIFGIMYAWDTGTKVERSQRRHMSPEDFLPSLNVLHNDEDIPLYADNLVYLTSDTELRRLDTDIFYSIFAGHPKRARAWWAVSVFVTDDPYTREYSVENFGTDFLFRVRIRLGFKVSQNVATYLHQIMHELIDDGTLPPQTTIYPQVDEDPEIGSIRYVLIHKELMPESKVPRSGAIALRMKYAIRKAAGSPIKWFGLATYNPLIEVQPLFVSTSPVAPLRRVNLRKTKKRITLEAVLAEKAAKAGITVELEDAEGNPLENPAEKTDAQADAATTASQEPAQGQTGHQDSADNAEDAHNASESEDTQQTEETADAPSEASSDARNGQQDSRQD